MSDPIPIPIPLVIGELTAVKKEIDLIQEPKKHLKTIGKGHIHLKNTEITFSIIEHNATEVLLDHVVVGRLKSRRSSFDQSRDVSRILNNIVDDVCSKCQEIFMGETLFNQVVDDDEHLSVDQKETEEKHVTEKNLVEKRKMIYSLTITNDDDLWYEYLASKDSLLYKGLESIFGPSVLFEHI